MPHLRVLGSPPLPVSLSPVSALSLPPSFTSSRFLHSVLTLQNVPSHFDIHLSKEGLLNALFKYPGSLYLRFFSILILQLASDIRGYFNYVLFFFPGVCWLQVCVECVSRPVWYLACLPACAV